MLFSKSILTFTTDLKDPQSATQINSGGAAWSNANNIFSSNNQYASVGSGAGVSSDWLVAHNFDFSEIPISAEILGIAVTVERKSTSTISYDVQLVGASGSLIGSAKSAFSTSSEDTITFGNASDLWGATLSGSVVRDSDYGVAIRSGDDSVTFDVDHVQMRITYRF